MTCNESLSIGAYVLGALEPADRRALDAHLGACPSCAAELAELAPLPQLLGTLSLDEFLAAEPQLPSDLFERVAAKVREDDRLNRLRTRKRWTAVAAAVVLIAGGIGGGLAASSDHQRHTFHASVGAVRMDVTVVGQKHGAELNVSIAGLPQQQQCELIAISRTGARESAGTWTATYAGNAHVTGSTSFAKAQLAQLVLLGTQGQRLIAVSTS